MFIEPEIGGNKGWIEVICGSMFSGKTEELIRRIKRVKIARLQFEIYKPAIDTRYDEDDVVSHDASAVNATPIENSQNILLLTQFPDVVAIDEAQFFDEEIISVCQKLAFKGVRVIIAGLDMDFKGQPFGPMPQLMAIADEVNKLHAICVKCGRIASLSYRKSADENKVLLGETDVYEPRCRQCYQEGIESENSIKTN